SRSRSKSRKEKGSTNLFEMERGRVTGGRVAPWPVHRPRKGSWRKRAVGAVRSDLRVRDGHLARPLSPCFGHALTPGHHGKDALPRRRALPNEVARRSQAVRNLQTLLRAARHRGGPASPGTLTAVFRLSRRDPRERAR